MKEKHTHAPWHVTQSANGAWDVHSDKHELATDLTEGNARLIAAAPMLLDACRKALAAFNSGKYPEDECRLLELGIETATRGKTT